MIFNRTYRYQTAFTIEEIKQRLNKNRNLKLNNQDFEISEKENMLRIIPNAEHVREIKTLPITHINFKGNGQKGTKIIISSKPRRIDAGGPYLIVIFCMFLIFGAGIIYLVSPGVDSFLPAMTMVGIGLLVFLIFWIRMESGYFRYIREIRKSVKNMTS